jgi:hypothetical protein
VKLSDQCLKPEQVENTHIQKANTGFDVRVLDDGDNNNGRINIIFNFPSEFKLSIYQLSSYQVIN